MEACVEPPLRRAQCQKGDVDASMRDVATVHRSLAPHRDVRHTHEAQRHDRLEQQEERVPRVRHPRRGGCHDPEEDRSTSPKSECLGSRAFSYEIRSARIPLPFCLPTNIDKYDRETNPSVWFDDFRLAC